MSTLEGGKQINNKNILFYFDAANVRSYVGTGSIGYSLVLGTTASLLTGVTWSSVNGGVMKFNGNYLIGETTYPVDSWMSCGDRISKLAPALPITLEAWINPKTTGVVDPYPTYGVFSLDAPEQFPGNYYGVSLNISSNNGTNTHNISTGYHNGVSAGPDGRKSVDSTNRVVKSGEWSHIVAVISNLSTMTLYYNGEAVAINVPSGTANTLVWSGGIGKTVIGKPTGYYKYLFNGDIAMVRAYNSNLSADDIKKNYNLHAVRFGLLTK